RSPKLLKGAIIQFSAPMLIPIPNIIIFEYNPETMTRTLTPWAPAERTYDEQGNMRELTREQKNALSQPFDPQESFTVSLFLDAPLLYPLRAKVNLGMRGLDDNDMVTIEGVLGPSTASVKIAKACYKFTRVQKELLATANLANTVESIISLLPS